MTLVPLPSLLTEARRRGYALGYFEAWDGYSLEAVVEAAEAEHSPVILGFGCLLVEREWLEAGGILALGRMGRAVAERAHVPVAFLLNETATVDQSLRGIDAGFNAVMMHGGDLADVVRLVREAHARGVAVEGELGELPTAGDPEGSSLTDPDEAAAFVAATGVDCLAVSVGNEHLLEERTAEIDLDRLEAIHRRVDVPLVIHGGTGFPADAVRPAIRLGVAKLNVGTVLKRSFLAGLVDAVAASSPDAGPHDLLGSHGPDDLLGAGKERMRDVVQDLIRLYGSGNRA